MDGAFDGFAFQKGDARQAYTYKRRPAQHRHRNSSVLWQWAFLLVENEVGWPNYKTLLYAMYNCIAFSKALVVKIL